MSSMPTPASSSRRTASAITPRALAHRHAHGAVLAASAARRPSRPARRSRARRRAGSSSATSSRSPPTLVLELVRGALGDHVAVVDHDDPVGEPVGLVEVLRGQQHGRAGRRRAPRSSPTGRAGCAGRGRWSARRGTAPAGGRRARRRGRAGGACRRSRSWRAARPASVSSKRSSSSSRAPARVLARQVVEPADHLEVLEAGQVLVDRRVLAGEADLGAQRGGVAHDVEARRRARVPRVGLAAAWRGSAPRWSCRRRWGRAGRARCPCGPRSRRRRARAPSRTTSRAPRRRSHHRSLPPNLLARRLRFRFGLSHLPPGRFPCRHGSPDRRRRAAHRHRSWSATSSSGSTCTRPPPRRSSASAARSACTRWRSRTRASSASGRRSTSTSRTSCSSSTPRASTARTGRRREPLEVHVYISGDFIATVRQRGLHRARRPPRRPAARGHRGRGATSSTASSTR